jgi:ribosome-associated toxin RatA of RatAB toxin-antitoxin module
MMLAASHATAEVETRVIELEDHDVTVRISGSVEDVSTVTAECVVPQSLPKVWRILTDYGHLNEIVPAVTVSRIVGHEAGATLLYQEGRAGLWIFERGFSVTFRVRETPMQSIEFEAFEGSFRRFVGSWKLAPSGGGTEIRHRVEVEPDFWAPRWALKRIAWRMMEDTIRSVVDRSLATESGAEASVTDGAAETEGAGASRAP